MVQAAEKHIKWGFFEIAIWSIIHKLKEPRLARGSFNLIPPSEPEPVSLSRDSHKPVGRLTGLDRFSGLNLHLDALLVRTNGLIQGVTTPTRSPQKNHALRVVLLI